MPWISRGELEELEIQAAKGRVALEALLGARRTSGRLSDVIHRQRLVIAELKKRLGAPKASVQVPVEFRRSMTEAFVLASKVVDDGKQLQS